jgi:hypothetical protein
MPVESGAGALASLRESDVFGITWRLAAAIFLSSRKSISSATFGACLNPDARRSLGQTPGAVHTGS